jgi:DNA-binding MarR family transcriptional regulator
MSSAGVTLHQVMLLANVQQGLDSPSVLARAVSVSLPAVTQNVDRLVEKGLLERGGDDPGDRRRRRFRVTRAAQALLARIEEARSAEYAAGLALVEPAQLEKLIAALEPVLRQTGAEEERVATRGRR